MSLEKQKLAGMRLGVLSLCIAVGLAQIPFASAQPAANATLILPDHAPEGFTQARTGSAQGKLETITYSSKSIGVDRKAVVYTPPNYDTSRKYPVLYLMHGIGGNETHWTRPGAGGANAEFSARRENGDSASRGIAGKWVAKDADNIIRLELRVEGSRFSGTFENTQMPGAIELKEGKIEGDNISFEYLRQMNGRDFQIKWTGTLSGGQLNLKRELGGGGMGRSGFGRGNNPAGN